MSRKVLWAIAIAGCIIVVTSGTFMIVNKVGNSPTSPDKLKIASFNSEGICAALMPTCGYCPGEEIDGNCYVTQAEFDEYKKRYSDLKASD
jgi:hypothetical protein